MSLIITPETTPADVSLVGRVLMLNTAVAPRFHCGGFSVSRNSPIQVVSRVAVEVQVRRALDAKILLDITGREDVQTGKTVGDIDKAIKDGNITKMEDEQVGPKCLIGTDSKGNSYVIMPKDEEEYESLQKELRENGFIRRQKPKTQNYSGLSSVYEEDLPEAPKT